MAIDWDAAVLGPVMGVFGGARPGAEGEITLHPASGAADIPLPDAVFDEGYTAVVLDAGEAVSTVIPALGVREARFATRPVQNDQVTIPGFGLYVVRDVRPDSHGHLLLLLNLVQPES